MGSVKGKYKTEYMDSMYKFRALFVFLASVVSCLVASAQSGAVDMFVKTQMKELQIPGVAVAVVKNGKIIKMKTYGKANLEWNIPVTEKTNFQIASVSKLFTSTLILKYFHSGIMHPDDPVSKYLPDSPGKWKNLRIRHLLAHESGLKWVSNIDPDSPSEKAYQALKDSMMEYEPGTKQFYVGGDYNLLRYILEKQSGKPFEQLMREEVFNPLQMKGSGYDMEKRKGSIQSLKPVPFKSHVYFGSGDSLEIFKFHYPSYTYTAGGMYSSVQDAARWAIAIDNHILFSKHEEELTWKKSDIVKDESTAFSQAGWVVENYQGHLITGHSGGPALGDIIRFPKEKLTIIVLNNQNYVLPYLAKAIATFYIKGLKMPEGPKRFNREDMQ